MQEITRTTHPAIIIAATAVTVASLTAIASLTGLLPNRLTPEPALTATAPASPADAAPSSLPPPATPAKTERVTPPPAAAKPHKTLTAAQNYPQATGDLRYASERTTTSRPASAPPSICRECGTVEAVREVSTPAEASGLGAVAGGVLGGLLGNQMGRGKGNAAATIVGAAGGAFAGHQTEKYVRAEKQLQVTVRFEDGSTRTLNQEGGNRWQIGDHVRLSNGSLLPN